MAGEQQCTAAELERVELEPESEPDERSATTKRATPLGVDLEPEPEPGPEASGSEQEESDGGGQEGLGFLLETFPSLSARDIGHVLKRFGGEICDRSLEAMFQLQADRTLRLQTSKDAQGGGGVLHVAGQPMEALDPKEAKEEKRRREALIERQVSQQLHCQHVRC